jgi:O-acetyl-ADP-ribose deacetylase (regulator of RNase III)
MEHMVGNLIDLAEEGRFDLIVHGCNCFCKMGAGIAKEIKSRYPQAYEQDRLTKYGDKNKMGGFSWAKVVSNRATVHPWNRPHGKRNYFHKFLIINAYTQYSYGGGKVNCDYHAIKSVFRAIKSAYPRHRIGYPLIGAGLGGGDWSRISKIISTELNGLDHALVTLK